MTDYTDLIDRLRKATGPIRGLDIALAALWPDPPFNLTEKTLRNRKPACPKFTASVDAALALVERVLPEKAQWWDILKSAMEQQGWEGARTRQRVTPETLPRFILIALLSALQHKEQTDD